MEQFIDDMWNLFPSTATKSLNAGSITDKRENEEADKKKFLTSNGYIQGDRIGLLDKSIL